MKCPSCQTVCSDLREKCPNCNSDLHPQKSSISYLGLIDPGEDITKILDQIIDETYLATSTLKQRKGEVVTGSSLGTSSISTSEMDHNETVTSEIIASPYLELPPTTASVPMPPSVELIPVDLFQERGSPVEIAFSDAFYDILSSGKPIDFEVGFAQLTPSQNDQETILLFDMAFDWIGNPEEEKKYDEAILKSDERKVEASGLVKELKKVEDRINAPILTLKREDRPHSRPPKSLKTDDSDSVSRTFEVASTGRRFVGFIVDGVANLMISACIVVFPLWMVDHSFFSRLREEDLKIIIDLPPVIASFLTLVIFCSVAYPALAFSLFGTTLGTWVTNMRLGTISGRRAKQSHILVRCLSFPLSLALLGFLPILFGKRAIHDSVSGTTFFHY